MGSKARDWRPRKTRSNCGHLFTDNDPAKQSREMDSRTRKLLYEQSSWQLNLDVHTKVTGPCVRCGKERRTITHQTNGMRQALSIFDEWLEKRKQYNVPLELETKQQFQKERQQRVLLVKSFANKHARRYCSSLANFTPLQNEINKMLQNS